MLATRYSMIVVGFLMLNRNFNFSVKVETVI